MDGLLRGAGTQLSLAESETRFLQDKLGAVANVVALVTEGELDEAGNKRAVTLSTPAVILDVSDEARVSIGTILELLSGAFDHIFASAAQLPPEKEAVRQRLYAESGPDTNLGLIRSLALGHQANLPILLVRVVALPEIENLVPGGVLSHLYVQDGQRLEANTKIAKYDALHFPGSPDVDMHRPFTGLICFERVGETRHEPVLEILESVATQLDGLITSRR